MKEDPFAAGVLDPDVHGRMVADIQRYADDAGIQPRWIWMPLADPEAEGGVVQASEETNNSGAASLGPLGGRHKAMHFSAMLRRPSAQGRHCNRLRRCTGMHYSSLVIVTLDWDARAPSALVARADRQASSG